MTNKLDALRAKKRALTEGPEPSSRRKVFDDHGMLTPRERIRTLLDRDTFFETDMLATHHGAYGYSREYPVERLLREAKLYQILEGSENICKMIIATDALGYRKANR